MSDPLTITCGAACTVTVIHELSLPPLQLTTEEGAMIAGAVLAIWAVGFGVRVLLQMLKTSDGNLNESE